MFNKKIKYMILFKDLVKRFSEIHAKIVYDVQVLKKRKSVHDDEMFNHLEFISYLANRDKILHKHVLDFLDSAIHDYYNNVYLKRYKTDTYIFQEWAQLHYGYPQEE